MHVGTIVVVKIYETNEKKITTDDLFYCQCFTVGKAIRSIFYFGDGCNLDMYLDIIRFSGSTMSSLRRFISNNIFQPLGWAIRLSSCSV